MREELKGAKEEVSFRRQETTKLAKGKTKKDDELAEATRVISQLKLDVATLDERVQSLTIQLRKSEDDASKEKLLLQRNVSEIELQASV